MRHERKIKINNKYPDIDLEAGLYFEREAKNGIKVGDMTETSQAMFQLIKEGKFIFIDDATQVVEPMEIKPRRKK